MENEMNLTLKSLHLKNWKGAIDQKIDFQKTTNIYLENEGGKTRILESWIWLFYGKHPEGKTDLDIKTKCTSRTKSHFPNNKIGDVIHNLTHSVTGIIVLGDREIELKKTFKETWGTTAKVKDKHLKTHTTTYSFDGHKCSKSKYESELAKIIDEQTFRMLTDPLHFSGIIHWSERRDILMKMCGEVDQKKIKGYNDIKDLIGTWGPEEKKQDLKSEIKKIKERKNKIPIQIEENQRLIIEIPEIKKTLSDATNEKASITDEINRIKSDSGEQNKRNQIAAIDTEILEKTAAFNIEKQKKIDILIDKGTTVKLAIVSTEEQIGSLEAQNVNNKNMIKEYEKGLLIYRDEFESAASEQDFIYKESPIFETTCPTCKQDLPADHIETSRENYNLEKSKRIEALENTMDKIDLDGKRLKDKIKELEDNISENNKSIEKKMEELTRYIKSRQSKIDELKIIRETMVEFPELLQKKAELEQIPTDKIDISLYDNLLLEVEKEISAINKRSLDIKKNEEYTKRIAELEDLESKLSQDGADLERLLRQLEDYIVSSVESQTDHINSMFEIATFKMYTKQVNGGINNDVCETVKDGIRFNAVNSAGKMQVGVDIIKQLQKFYNAELPIFVDNRESITNLPQVDCQLINLFVSPEDTNMRIEYERD